jgi:hypothetical protein
VAAWDDDLSLLSCLIPITGIALLFVLVMSVQSIVERLGKLESFHAAEIAAESEEK